MGFEDTLGNLGRWLDDRKDAFRNRTSAGDRFRAAKESISDSMRAVKEGAAERIGRAKESHLDRDDPRTQRSLLVIGLILVLVFGVAMGVWFAPRFWGGGGLSSDEVAALEKMKKTGGNDMFVTTPPPSDTSDAAKPKPTLKGSSLTAPPKSPPHK